MNVETARAPSAVFEITGKACSSEELVKNCLARIAETEKDVAAWAFLDEKLALKQASQADAGWPAIDGKKQLCGVPVGIKDIFDTRDMPTENGTVIHQGRRPSADAAAVERLRNAGAVILGKTVTAELAVYTPGKTRNPHDLTRTPGGSSSGSAAAVAAGMVPLALGTQTNGSVIRPASFCGVVGFKPTFGTIPRSGVLRQAPSLDQIGVFSKTVRQSALLASVLMGREPKYGDTLPWPAIDCRELSENDGRPPVLGFVKTPVWNESAPESRSVFLNYLKSIGAEIKEIELPAICSSAVSCHRSIMLSEMSHNYREMHLESRSQISPALLSMLDEGIKISRSEYLNAKNLSLDISGTVDYALHDFDAVLTPATPAEAPVGLDSTGSPVFSTIWSLCGVPAISLPVMQARTGMPLGLQLVAGKGCDLRLLMAAEWLEKLSMPNDGKAEKE